MNVTRRQTFALGAGAVAFATLATGISPALASEASDKLVADFTGGKKATAGKVKLKTPEIAENGNTVPISFSVESPMTSDDHVASVLVLALGNPGPNVATFNFSAMSGKAEAATRVRLAKTQEILAIAKMSDGSLFMDKKTVKVTIGGCGG